MRCTAASNGGCGRSFYANASVTEHSTRDDGKESALTNPANTMRFDVKIDGIELGSFTALDGLSAHYEVVPYKEGGNNEYIHQLPGRLEYDRVKLSRAVD